MESFENTNLEWIAEIPSNWNLRKIKYIFDERKEMNNPIKSKNLISLTIEKGVIPHSQKKAVVTNLKKIYLNINLFIQEI